MNTKALAQVIRTESKGSTEKDGVIEIGDDTTLTVYANLGSETLVIASVASVSIVDELLMATTTKGESYAVVAQDIRALRFGKGPSGRRTGLI